MKTKKKEKKPVDTSKVSGGCGLNSIPQGGGDKPTTIIKDKKDIPL